MQSVSARAIFATVTDNVTMRVDGSNETIPDVRMFHENTTTMTARQLMDIVLFDGRFWSNL